jgi:hypothetical protein
MQSTAAAVVGIVRDPLTGWQQAGLLGIVVGLLKAIVGFPVRPMAGAVECLSKSTQGCALVCLGRSGIQGRITRRIYAPGITRRLQDQHEVCLQITLQDALRCGNDLVAHCVGGVIVSPAYRLRSMNSMGHALILLHA